MTTDVMTIDPALHLRAEQAMQLLKTGAGYSWIANALTSSDPRQVFRALSDAEPLIRSAMLRAQPYQTPIEQEASSREAEALALLDPRYRTAIEVAQAAHTQAQQQLAAARAKLHAHEAQRLSAPDVQAWAEARRVLVDTVTAYQEREAVAGQQVNQAGAVLQQALTQAIGQRAQQAFDQWVTTGREAAAVLDAKEAELKALERELNATKAAAGAERAAWRQLAQRYGLNTWHLMSDEDKRRSQLW